MDIQPLPSAAATSDEFLLNIGPQHPATHGVLRVVVTMDGEVVKDIVPHIGYVHRGLEKLFENRTYEQIIPFTDRTDYLSAIANNFAYARGVEKLLGLEVPKKVEYMRVLMAELNRIASHLLWLAAYGLDMGAFTPFLYAFRDREEIVSMIEEASGGRLTTNYFRVGGFVHDLPKDFFERLRKFLSRFGKALDELDTLLVENAIFVARTRGVGVIGKERAVSYGMDRTLPAGVERGVRCPARHAVFSLPVASVRDSRRKERGHLGPVLGEDRGDAAVPRDPPPGNGGLS